MLSNWWRNMTKFFLHIHGSRNMSISYFVAWVKRKHLCISFVNLGQVASQLGFSRSRFLCRDLKIRHLLGDAPRIKHLKVEDRTEQRENLINDAVQKKTSTNPVWYSEDVTGFHSHFHLDQGHLAFICSVMINHRMQTS